MKYYKIAYGLLVNRFLSALFVSIEIAALLILANTVTATYNSKNLLLKPYRDILQSDGVVLDVSSLWEDENDFDNTMQIIKTNCYGNITIHHTDTLSFWTPNGPNSTLYREQGCSIEYFLIDDDIFSKFRMPLEEGRWASSEKTSDGEIEIVISQGTDAKLGQTYDTAVGKIKIVGILTENTYRPPCSNNHRSDNENEYDSIFTYYEPFDASVNLGGAFAIADKKLFPKQSGENYNVSSGSIWFISFDNNLTPDQIKMNTDFLKTVGFIQENENYHTLLSSSEKTINNIYLRMLPIIIVAALVVLSGLIGTISLLTLRNMKSFGIFFIYGCDWTKIIKIISAYLSFIFAATIIWFIIGMNVLNRVNLSYLIGMSYDNNNIYISIVMVVILYITAIIIPYSLIKATSPIETIKEGGNL